MNVPAWPLAWAVWGAGVGHEDCHSEMKANPRRLAFPFFGAAYPPRPARAAASTVDESDAFAFLAAALNFLKSFGVMRTPMNSLRGFFDFGRPRPARLASAALAFVRGLAGRLGFAVGVMSCPFVANGLPATCRRYGFRKLYRQDCRQSITFFWFRSIFAGSVGLVDFVRDL